MNFNIYLDDELGAKINEWIKKYHVTRNSVIREAIKMFLEKNTNKWPDDVLQFKGIADFPAFEKDRVGFKDLDEDPFK